MNIFLIAATTIDGMIGKGEDHVSTQWTSKADFKWFQQKTKEAGLCVMGSTTFRTIGRLLPNRTTIVMTRHPQKISQDYPNITYRDLEAATENTADLNTEVLYTTQLKPLQLQQLLSEAGYKNLAICGGSSIYTQFLQAGLVETMYLTVEPLLFGSGIPLLNAAIKEASQQWHLKEVHHLSQQTIVLEYRSNLD